MQVGYFCTQAWQDIALPCITSDMSNFVSNVAFAKPPAGSPCSATAQETATACIPSVACIQSRDLAPARSVAFEVFLIGTGGCNAMRHICCKLFWDLELRAPLRQCPIPMQPAWSGTSRPLRWPRLGLASQLRTATLLFKPRRCDSWLLQRGMACCAVPPASQAAVHDELWCRMASAIGLQSLCRVWVRLADSVSLKQWLFGWLGCPWS